MKNNEVKNNESLIEFNETINILKDIKKKEEESKNKSTKGFSTAMNILENMKKDDLIWTRRNNTFYICRVISNEKYHCPKNKEKMLEYLKNKNVNITYEEAELNDIWHFVECEFYEVGTEEAVLGTIVNNMKVGGTTQGFKKNKESVLEFSKRVYNEKSKKDYYKLDIPKDKWSYFWSGMLAEELEELVGLYLQIKKNYGIYSSTCKNDTKQYEFVLFEKDTGKKAYLQVKEHNISLDDYNDITKNNLLYIFSNNDTEYESKANIIRITKIELQKFIEENKNILPYKILRWLR